MSDPIGDIFGAIGNAVGGIFGSILGSEPAPKRVAEPARKPQTRTEFARAGEAAPAGAIDTPLSRALRGDISRITSAVAANGGGPARPADRSPAVPPTAPTGTPLHEPGGWSSRVSVYRGGADDGTLGTPVGRGSEVLARAADNDARAAVTNVEHGLRYFERTFGHSGVDDAGSGVSIVVDDRSRDETGAERFHGNAGYYVTEGPGGRLYEAMRFGGEKQFQTADGRWVDQRAMQYATDMTVHELSHGFIKHITSRLAASGIGSEQLGGHADEASAVNEAIADVFAAAATRDEGGASPWVMGEQLYRDTSSVRMLRDISSPRNPQALHHLWTHVSEARSEAFEEHYASGIISTAAHRIQQRLAEWDEDASWQGIEQLFYGALTSGRMGNFTFAEAAQALRQTASQLWPGTVAAQIVDEELRAAGL